MTNPDGTKNTAIYTRSIYTSVCEKKMYIRQCSNEVFQCSASINYACGSISYRKSVALVNGFAGNDRRMILMTTGVHVEEADLVPKPNVIRPDRV
jgi:hypothetical protein